MFVPLRKNRDFLESRPAVFFFFLSVALVFVAHGLQATLFPLLERERHLSLLVINIAAAVQLFGCFIGTLLAPFLIRRVGYGYSLWLSFLGLAVAVGSFPWLSSYWGFFLDRLLCGFCCAVFYVNLDGWINETSHDGIRARVMSVYFMFNFGFMMVGSLLLRLGSVTGYILPLVGFSFALASCLTLFCVRRVPVVTSCGNNGRPLVLSRRLGWIATNIWELSLERPLGVLGMFVMGLASSPFWDFGPLFARSVPAELDASCFMVAVISGGVLGQYPVASLSDRFGRRGTIGWVALFGALSSSLISLLPVCGVTVGYLYVISGFLFGMCVFQLYMLSAAYAFDHVREMGGSFVDTSSWFLLLYLLGACSGQLLSFVLMMWTGRVTVIFLPGILGSALVFVCCCVQVAREWFPRLRL